MITTALASLLGGGFGALEWRRIARRHAGTTVENALRRARHVIAIVPVALVLLAVQVVVVTHPDITWNAPVWLELHYTSLLFGSVAACMSFVFGLAGHGAMVTRHRHRVPLLASTLIVVGIVVTIEWDFTTPIWSDLHERMNGYVVLQSTGASCAAASAANLVRQHGVVQTEREMAALLGTTRFGSTPAQVVHGLERLGFSCRKVFHANADSASVRAPAVLFYPPGDIYSTGHAVLLASAEAHNAIVLDPLVGRVLLNPVELSARWKGHAVECDPPPFSFSTATRDAETTAEEAHDLLGGPSCRPSRRAREWDTEGGSVVLPP